MTPPWGIFPFLLPVESFLLMCSCIAAMLQRLLCMLRLCPGSSLHCAGCPGAGHGPRGQQGGKDLVRCLRADGRKAVTSSALPLLCVHIIPGTAFPRCFARQPGQLPRRARINCEEATGYCRVYAEVVLPAWLGNAEGRREVRP